MEVKGRTYTVNSEYVSQTLNRIYLEDIIHVKHVEGSNKFTFKGYKRPIGGMMMVGHNRNRVTSTGFTIKVDESEVQAINDILVSSIPQLKVEKRNIGFLEINQPVAGISFLLMFAAIMIFVLNFVGVVSFPSFLQNPVVLFGAAAAIIVLINILCYVKTDKDKEVRIFISGARRY